MGSSIVWCCRIPVWMGTIEHPSVSLCFTTSAERNAWFTFYGMIQTCKAHTALFLVVFHSVLLSDRTVPYHIILHCSHYLYHIVFCCTYLYFVSYYIVFCIISWYIALLHIFFTILLSYLQRCQQTGWSERRKCTEKVRPVLYCTVLFFDEMQDDTLCNILYYR